MAAGNFRDLGSFPLNAVGPKGQHAFVGVEKVFFTGTTGQVGTAYGIPDVAVTRTATGAYSVTFPPVQAVDIIPGIQAPSGSDLSINVNECFPGSGTAKFNITRTVSSVGSGAAGASATVRQYNPASGTVANLLFFVSPITPF